MTIEEIEAMKNRIKPYVAEITKQTQYVVERGDSLCCDDLLNAFANVSGANKEILNIIQTIPKEHLDLKLKMLKLNSVIQQKVSASLDGLLDMKLEG